MTEAKQLDASLLGLPPLPSHSPDTIAALLWAREVMQEHQKKLYSVTHTEGIEELKAVNIGGVDQWLHIRGRNRNNPVLLFLHGGPGSGMIGFMDAWQRPWEDYFTVVQWDQRQCGKSYYPADDENNPLTIEQFISDTEEVIQHLRSHLDKDKIVLMGISWGTMLGAHMAKRHPEWLHAYVGIGQVVNLMDNERTLFERTLSHAKAQGKDELVTKLEAIAPYPDPDRPVESFLKDGVFTTLRQELSELAGETAMHHMPWDDIFSVWTFGNTISPHLSLTDLSNAALGDKPALVRSPSFTREFVSIDLPRQVGSTFDIPIFFFSGCHDWQTPKVLSDQWFETITAPHKALIPFEGSAHGVPTEEPGKFLVALVNQVLPFVKE